MLNVFRELALIKPSVKQVSQNCDFTDVAKLKSPSCIGSHRQGILGNVVWK